MGIDAKQLQKRLEDTLTASVEVIDESHLHAGHAGARDGGKHFRVRLKSPKFQGLGTLARHRLVYDAVSDWMPKEIHALAIDAASVD
jgi:BolA family transcriptional regulator, general stress-responsive regulator